MLILILYLVQAHATLFAQRAANVRYSPAWFGPNANPVPEMTDARIARQTTISLMGDHYYGSGDNTTNGYLKVEVPLFPARASIKVWSAILEHYSVNEEVFQKRCMRDRSGKATGDIYLQTRISLLTERRVRPSIILNSTLRTASGTDFSNRRYYDAPGYYFDLELGKSFYTTSHFIKEIRLVADAGFMCWETTESRQNDAPMYGGKLIVSNNHWRLENALAGYDGWMSIRDPEQGDAPCVYTAKLAYMRPKAEYFVQYQYGLHDYPYQLVRAGFSLFLDKLTPKFR